MTSVQNGSQTKKLKILCMHGFGTNKEFMKMQTQILRRDLQLIAQLIYVDGPFIVPLDLIDDPKVLKNIVGPPRSWLDMKTVNKTGKIENVTIQNNIIRAAIQEASDYYDGALCFSQGSYAFQYLLWNQAMGRIDWPIIKDMKFFINFSADSFRISLKSLNFKKFQIPSLHFLSEQDFLFNRCIISPSLFKDPEIIYHTFGHRFPVLGIAEKQQLRNFLKKYGFSHKKRRGIEAESRL